MAEKDKRAHVGLRDLDDAKKLATKRSETESLRTDLKREWALNRAFYNSQQWSFWNPQMLRVEGLPADSGPKWKVRIVSNQIKPGLAHYVAQLTKTRPTVTAEPDSGADKDIKAAQMAESLYEYLWDEKQLNSKAQDALTEAGLSGGFWKISWDALAGKPMTFTIDPEGNPILDDDLASAFITELEQIFEQSGMDPSQAAEMAKKTVYLGDIDIEVMTAENVLLDPAVGRFEDCGWAICRHTMDPDEIEARWGVKVDPNVSRSPDVPLPYTEDKRPNTLREVFIMYIRPQPAHPKGRYVVWIEGPDKILQDLDWPYPFNELPLVKFPGTYRPQSPYDDPITTDSRSIQKDINKTLSQVVEHKNMTMRPQMLAPIGSLRSKLTSEPGAVFEYNPVGNLVPQWRETPGIPAYVFNHLADLQLRMDKVFNRLPSSRDQLPPRADSGHLLEAMQEAVADQLSTVTLGIEDALARAGKLMAAYAQTYYEEPRLLKIRGQGGSVQVKKFQASDIAGGFTFRPRYGTGLPRTREGKRAALLELHQAQLVDARTVMKHLDLGDLQGVQSKLAQDEDHAHREMDKMRRGQPLNERAIQEAQMQMQQFQAQAQQVVQMVEAGQPVDVNGDGQPEEPQQILQVLQQQFQQLQQALQDAPWQPLPFEDSAAHIDVHQSFLKSVEFEGYPPEMKQIFEKHFELTMAKLQSERQSDPALLPKLNVTAKATTSAKVLAKILEAQGIMVSPEEVAEEPLETAVYDSVDKPDQDSAGNDPLTQEEHGLMMQQKEDEHLTAQAAATQKMAQAALDQERKAQLHDAALERQAIELERAAEDSARADEQHQQELELRERQARAKEQQAAQPKPKGK